MQPYVQWFKNKMNVKLAAQTLSESCAVALEQLPFTTVERHLDFSDCIATAKFCRMVNNAFDCLNSKSLCSNTFKKPLSQENVKEIFIFLMNASIIYHL